MPVGRFRERQSAIGRIGDLRLALALTVLLAIACLFLTTKYRQVDLTVPDNVGYMRAGHQLAQGEGLAFSDPHNRLDARYYTLHTFKVIRPGNPNRYFDHPPGLPLLAALAEALTRNPAAIHLVVPLMAAALVGTICILGTLLGEAWVGFWAGLTLLSSAIFLTFSTSLWSEVPSAALLYAGCTLHIASSVVWPNGSRGATALSLLGGLVIGATFFIRFSNLAVLPAIVPLAVYGVRVSSRVDARPFVLGAGILVAAGALLVFNTIYYGGPLVTAYTPEHGWYAEPAFSLSYAFGESFAGGYSALAIGRALLHDFGWFLPLAVVGAVWCERTIRLLLLSLIGFLLLPYAVYAFSAGGLNGRFVLPAWPAICLLIGQGIVFLFSKLQRTGWRWGVGLLLAGCLLYPLPSHIAEQAERNQASHRAVEQVVQMASLTEPDAVIMSYVFNDLFAVYGARSVLNYRHIVPYDPALNQYLFDEFEPMLVAEVNHLLNQGVPTYIIQDHESTLQGVDGVLERHFSLVPVEEQNVVWRILPTKPLSTPSEATAAFERQG